MRVCGELQCGRIFHLTLTDIVSSGYAWPVILFGSEVCHLTECEMGILRTVIDAESNVSSTDVM